MYNVIYFTYGLVIKYAALTDLKQRGIHNFSFANDPLHCMNEYFDKVKNEIIN